MSRRVVNSQGSLVVVRLTHTRGDTRRKKQKGTKSGKDHKKDPRKDQASSLKGLGGDPPGPNDSALSILFPRPLPLACPPPRQRACLLLVPNLSRGITGVGMSALPLPLGRLLGDFTALRILRILRILSHVPPRHPLCSLGMHQLQLQIQIRLPWTTPLRACRRDSARSRRCQRRSSRTF